MAYFVLKDDLSLRDIHHADLSEPVFRIVMLGLPFFRGTCSGYRQVLLLHLLGQARSRSSVPHQRRELWHH